MVLQTSNSSSLPVANSKSSVTVIGDGSGEKHSDSPDPQWPVLSRTTTTTEVNFARPPTTSSLMVASPNETLNSSLHPTDLHFDGSVSKQELPAETPTEKNNTRTSANGGKKVVGKDPNQGPIQSSPLLGAWTKKLNISSTSTYQKPSNGFSGPETAEDAVRFPWAAKMNPASRNLYRAVEPEYLQDGTPKVTVPPHVLLQGLENQKEYVLGQFHRCSLPPGGLIHAGFNKLWGRNCKITIRKLGGSSYLFHIPEESTRTWVLQRGLWHVDDCLMFVAPWTPKASLAIPEIKTIPVWVTLKNIPNILYSIPGISHIASGLGAPMATHKPRLDPIFTGEAKILVEVELSKAFPPRIAADDKNGFISMVDVEYAWLPSNCSRCGQLGHKVKRCLQAVNESHSKVLAATSVVVDTVPQSVPTNTSKASTSTNEVSFSNILVDETTVSTLDEPFSDCMDDLIVLATNSILENMYVSAHQSAPVIITINDFVETPILEPASISIVQEGTVNDPSETSVLESASVTIVQEECVLAKPDLGSNKFSSLISLEENEDSVDSDKDMDPIDLMTPYGKRILRDRPVKPSAKAKDMHWQFSARGRGNQGRGNRGGRG